MDIKNKWKLLNLKLIINMLFILLFVNNAFAVTLHPDGYEVYSINDLTPFNAPDAFSCGPMGGTRCDDYFLQNIANEMTKKSREAFLEAKAKKEKISQHITQIVSNVTDRVEAIEANFLAKARGIFWFCFWIEVVWLGVKSILGQNDLSELFKNFAMATITAFCFHWIITNYSEVAKYIVALFSDTSGGDVNKIVSALPFANGLQIAEALAKGVEPLPNIGTYIIVMLSAAAVIFIFTLISLQIIILKIEMIVGVICSAVLLGFGACSFVRDYAINAIKFIFTLGLKFMAINVVLNMGYGILMDMANVQNPEPMDSFVIVATVLFY